MHSTYSILNVLQILISAFLIFIMGTFWCGFFQCMIYRRDTLADWKIRRSFCDTCKRTLIWIDSVPVISYIILKGKCRYCHAPVPAKYCIAETISGLVALGLVCSPLPLFISIPLGILMIFIIAYSFYFNIKQDYFAP